MLPEKFLEVLRYEGAVAIATTGIQGQHLVNTWNSYIQVTPDERLLIPAGGMTRTERNISENNRALLTIASREVVGLKGRPGAGFFVHGTAEFISSGDDFEAVRKKFPWARAALRVTVTGISQTL